MVSICCITYNQEAYIRDALDGFIKQKTNFQWELLIHDDASTDRTAEIIREYAKRYPDRIFPILQTENQYCRDSRTSVERLISREREENILRCVRAMTIGRMRRNSSARSTSWRYTRECSLCLHSARIEVQGKAITEHMMRPYRRSRKIRPEEIIDKTSGYPTASLMFRKSMVEHLPDFYVNAPIADIPLQLMSANRGWAYYMDRCMCVYRLGGSASWTTLMKQGNYEEKQRNYARAMEEMYRGFDRESGERFHQTVERASARIRFLTWVNTRKYEKVFDRKYRRFYRELNLRTRFFIRLETMAPGFYAMLQKRFHRAE